MIPPLLHEKKGNYQEKGDLPRPVQSWLGRTAMKKMITNPVWGLVGDKKIKWELIRFSAEWRWFKKWMN